MKKVLLAIGLCISTAGAVRAADVGDPVFPVDLDDKARAEIIYQNLNRDLDTGASLEADAYLLRIHTDVGKNAYLDFDVGGIDPSNGDLGFYGGIGMRFLAYDNTSFRLSPWLQVHYAPNLTDGENDLDFLDGDAGLLLAGKIKIGDQLTLMPYAGPALSIIRADGDGGNADEDQLLGGVVGVSLQMPGQNTFRIEAQFYDQASISAAAGIVF